MNATENHKQQPASPPQLIAHRGDCYHYPENSLAAVIAACETGAHYLEVDVQLSADGIPVLFHDDRLERITGETGRITATNYTDLPLLKPRKMPQYIADKSVVQIPRLSDLVSILVGWPAVTAFVEIKEASLLQFGVEKVVTTVMDIIIPAKDQCVLISFDRKAIQYARQLGAVAIGWILHNFNESTHRQANELDPEYLFCNYTKLPVEGGKLWPGNWHWALYEVTAPQLALELSGRGARFIETMDIANMIHHPALKTQ